MTFSTATAIDIHRTALLRIVAMLLAASGLGSGKPSILSRIIRNSVLDQLRTAEAACRRLVVMLVQEMASRGVVLKPRPKRAAPSNPIPRGKGASVPAFALTDPRKRLPGSTPQRFAKGAGPRLSFLDGSDPVREPAPEKAAVSLEDRVDATGVCRRLLALQAALGDLRKQARRMMRRQAREGARRPMRPGRPPGYRARQRYEVDDVLRECHLLALTALAAPDTS